MKLSRALLWVAALGFGGFGLAFCLFPRQLGAYVGIILQNDSARTDFVATYGGLELGVAAGRPQGAESWEETLRRETWEEACASVESVRLLGFTRGRCVRGKQEGEALVRAFWRAEAVVEPWDARFEIGHRRLVPAAVVLSHLHLPATYLPIYLRALEEAALT